MKPESGWKLTIAASHNDGTFLLFELSSSAHAQVKELVDSELALLEFTLVVPRFQAKELQDALTLDDRNSRPRNNQRLAATD